MNIIQRAGHVTLGLGIGILVGFVIGNERSEDFEPATQESAWMHSSTGVRVVRESKPADERPKRDTETCIYTKPAGRPTYTLAIPTGETCVTILGD